MVKLRNPKYLRIYEMQNMLKYIFLNEKRPHFIQLKKKPDHVTLVLVNKPFTRINSDQPLESRFISSLQSLGITSFVHINEHIELDYIFNNILKSIDVDTVDISYITKDTLDLVEKHDVLHLFSYSSFIKSKTDFNPSLFNSYVRPIKKTKYFLISIDCEMVKTIEGTQIGRLTMLDHQGNVLYDKYIKPRSVVLDYLEKYSGLNYYNTSNGISFEQMQNEILEFIGTETYILGHGLENDLEALQLYSDKVIDTAYLFLSSEGYKIKLSQLVHQYFNQNIQVGTHNSKEDAMSCLKLLAYKIMQIVKFHDENGTFIDLKVEIKSNENIKDLEVLEPKRVLHFIEADHLSYSLIPKNDNNYVVYFYTVDDKNYIAFRQN